MCPFLLWDCNVLLIMAKVTFMPLRHFLDVLFLSMMKRHVKLQLHWFLHVWCNVIMCENINKWMHNKYITRYFPFEWQTIFDMEHDSHFNVLLKEHSDNVGFFKYFAMRLVFYTFIHSSQKTKRFFGIMHLYGQILKWTWHI